MAHETVKHTDVDAKIGTHETGAKHRWTSGKLLKGAGANVPPTEIDVPAGATTIRKIADEIVNNSTVLQNDDHLFFAVGANEVWALDLLLLVYGDSTADMRYAWAIPTGGDIRIVRAYDHDGVSATRGGTVAVEVTGVALTPTWPGSLWFRAIYIGGVNAGNVQFQWAQKMAVGADTKVVTNSYFIPHKLN